MLNRLIFIFLLIFTFSGCKKENDSPQWDLEVYGPVFHATLGISQMIADSSLETTAQGAQILFYDNTISEFKLDSIYQIADTTIQTISIFPPFPSIIPPGTTFLSNNNNIALNAGNVQLRKAIIYSGKIRLEIKNTLQSKINFIYNIPKATKGGHQFSVTASVDSASLTNPKYFTQDYDFSGYDVDMTGSNGSSFNTISYDVKAISDPAGDSFPVFGSDTMLNLKTTLVQLQPYFVKGYLGQADIQEVSSKSIGLGPLVKNGTIILDSIQLNLDVINYIGADEQGYISHFSSINNRTGNTVDLVAPNFIQHYLNINRASIDPALTDSLVPTYYSIQLDNTNSNIKALLENTPDSLNIDAKFNLNPLGNISGSNDFVYRDKLIDTRIRFRMPLRFAMDQLLLADTVPFTVANKASFDPVGPMTLTLLADNGFPFDMNVQFFLLDNTQTIVDSLLIPDLIKAAPVDINYRASGIQRTKIIIQIDEERKKRLLSVERVGIRLKFNTPDYPQLIQMYSDYQLKLKLIADGIYSIR